VLIILATLLIIFNSWVIFFVLKKHIDKRFNVALDKVETTNELLVMPNLKNN